MLLLVWLAVYVGDAGQDGGQGFALIYAGYFTLLTWLWFTVRRQDDGVFDVITRRYLAVMVLIVATMIGSAWLPAAQRVLVWALVIVVWMVSALVISRTTMDASEPGFFVGDSLVERFGLFTIIVLGEVVVGVVDGLRNVVREPLTVATGLVALTIGFGLWWNYFDLTRGRHPREQPTGISIWMFVHLPLTMSIAAAGAAMVVVVEHASEDRTPAGASWLLTAAVAMGLVSLAGVVRTLEAYESLRVIYGPTSRVMVVAAVVALFVGLMRPPGLLLVFLLAVIQAGVWVYALSLWLRTEEAAATLD
jgi:low temperature requirement protein LtrA